MLRNWAFLPLWMRSLEPMDKVIGKLGLCKKCRGDADGGDLPIIKPIQAPNNCKNMVTPTLINGRLVANFSASELESLVMNKDESPDRVSFTGANQQDGPNGHVITICKDLHTIEEQKPNGL